MLLYSHAVEELLPFCPGLIGAHLIITYTQNLLEYISLLILSATLMARHFL